MRYFRVEAKGEKAPVISGKVHVLVPGEAFRFVKLVHASTKAKALKIFKLDRRFRRMVRQNGMKLADVEYTVERSALKRELV